MLEAPDRRLGRPGGRQVDGGSTHFQSARSPTAQRRHVKECLADVLGLGDEAWSNSLGDAAAATVFRLARDCPGAVVEGWWRRERRERAIVEFAGAVEVLCHCEPSLAEQRLAERLAEERHPIHRDVINPSIVAGVSDAARTSRLLGLGGLLIQVDSAEPVDPTELVRAIAAPR